MDVSNLNSEAMIIMFGKESMAAVDREFGRGNLCIIIEPHSIFGKKYQIEVEQVNKPLRLYSYSDSSI